MRKGIRTSIDSTTKHLKEKTILLNLIIFSIVLRTKFLFYQLCSHFGILLPLPKCQQILISSGTRLLLLQLGLPEMLVFFCSSFIGFTMGQMVSPEMHMGAHQAIRRSSNLLPILPEGNLLPILMRSSNRLRIL